MPPLFFYTELLCNFTATISYVILSEAIFSDAKSHGGCGTNMPEKRF